MLYIVKQDMDQFLEEVMILVFIQTFYSAHYQLILSENRIIGLSNIFNKMNDKFISYIL